MVAVFPAILQLPEIGATQLRHVRGVGTCGSTMGESDLWGRFGRAQSTLREASPIKDAPVSAAWVCVRRGNSKEVRIKFRWQSIKADFIVSIKIYKVITTQTDWELKHIKTTIHRIVFIGFIGSWRFAIRLMAPHGAAWRSTSQDRKTSWKRDSLRTRRWPRWQFVALSLSLCLYD